MLVSLVVNQRLKPLLNENGISIQGDSDVLSMTLPPKYYHNLLGRSVNRNLKKGAAVDWDLVD